jgi:predicted DNA-binding ribbon-helix-helix protein
MKRIDGRITTINFEKEDYDEMKAVCEKERISFSSLVRWLVKKHLIEYYQFKESVFV